LILILDIFVSLVKVLCSVGCWSFQRCRFCGCYLYEPDENWRR